MRFRVALSPAFVTVAAAGALAVLALDKPAASVAQTAPSSLTHNCSVVGSREAATILGYDVQDADETAMAGDNCTFSSRMASEDGLLSYSILTSQGLEMRRPFFRLMARRCAGVTDKSANARICKTYVAVAQAQDLDAYYAARIDTPDTKAEPGLGDAAAATPTAVYVRRGGEIFECVVRKAEFLDTDASLALARILLDRVTPIAGPPLPSPTP